MHSARERLPSPRVKAITTTICALSGAIPQPADSAGRRRLTSRRRPSRGALISVRRRRDTSSPRGKRLPRRCQRRAPHRRVRPRRGTRSSRIPGAHIPRGASPTASRGRVATSSVPARRPDSQSASSRQAYSNRRPTTANLLIDPGSNPSVSRGAEPRVSIRSIPTGVLRSTDPERPTPSDPCGVDCGRSTVDSWPGCLGRYTESALIRPSPGSTRKNGFSSRTA